MQWAETVPITAVPGKSSALDQDHVLVCLASHADSEGDTSMNVQVIATEVRLKPGAVSAALSALEAQRLIVAVSSRTGGRHPTTWRLGCVDAATPVGMSNGDGEPDDDEEPF